MQSNFCYKEFILEFQNPVHTNMLYIFINKMPMNLSIFYLLN